MSGQDSSRAALDLVHRLVSLPVSELPGLHGLLTQLVEAFAANEAGLATLATGVPIVSTGSAGTRPALFPGENDAAWRTRLVESGVLVLPRPPQGSLALTTTRAGDGVDWLLWIQDERRTTWTRGETAALALFADVLARNEAPGRTAPRWLEQRERLLRQQRLEEAASWVRRLAHDFGNTLTAVLGFAELSLGQQVHPGSALHDYLSELQRGAQHAAHWTQLLRLFSLRPGAGAHACCSLADALHREEGQHRLVWQPTAELVLDMPYAVPSPTVADEHLRQVVRILLENAYDSLPNCAGVVTVSVRRIDLAASECLDYYGCPRPGPNVEIRVSDTGTGLTPEVQQRLFGELFFTTKPRRRGLGLAVAFGLVSANRGGLRLHNGPGQGAVAEVVFPVMAASVPSGRIAAQDPAADVGKVPDAGEDSVVPRLVSTKGEPAH